MSNFINICGTLYNLDQFAEISTLITKDDNFAPFKIRLLRKKTEIILSYQTLDSRDNDFNNIQFMLTGGKQINPIAIAIANS